VEVLWLLGKLTPDFKTIADFRKDNLKPLQAVARQFTVLCRKLELFGGELLAIDGSKFEAVNAREQNFNADKLPELIDQDDARLAEYLQELDRPDVEGGILPLGTNAQIARRVRNNPSPLALRAVLSAGLGSPAPRQAGMPAATSAPQT
jgi:hypothetical protein